MTTPNPAARSCSSPFLRGVPLAYIHPPGRRSSSTPGSGAAAAGRAFPLRCHRRVPAPQQLLVHPFSAWKTPGAAASGCVGGEGGTGPGAPRSLQQAAACPHWGWGPAAPPRPASPGAPLSLSIPPRRYSPSTLSLPQLPMPRRGDGGGVCVGGGDRAGPHPAAPPSLSRAPGQPEGLLLAALTPPPPPPPPAPAARMP